MGGILPGDVVGDLVDLARVSVNCLEFEELVVHADAVEDGCAGHLAVEGV